MSIRLLNRTLVVGLKEIEFRAHSHRMIYGGTSSGFMVYLPSTDKLRFVVGENMVGYIDTHGLSMATYWVDENDGQQSGWYNPFENGNGED